MAFGIEIQNGAGPIGGPGLRKKRMGMGRLSILSHRRHRLAMVSPIMFWSDLGRSGVDFAVHRRMAGRGMWPVETWEGESCCALL